MEITDYINLQTITSFILGVIGTAFTFTNDVIRKWVFDKFDEGKRSKENKRILADEVTKVIAEALSSGYRKNPRDIEYIMHLAIQVSYIDEKVKALYFEYLQLWFQTSELYGFYKVSETKQNLKKYEESKHAIRVPYSELTKLLKEWKK